MSAMLVARQSIFCGAGEGERISFNGVEIIFKSPAGFEDGWTVLDYTLPAGQYGAVLHYHRELIESFYILEGNLWFRLDGAELEAGPGSFVLVNPETKHAFANRTNKPIRFLAHASSADHKRFLMELFALIQSSPTWPPNDLSQIRRLGERYDTLYV
jgi:mannose-6-phosphate isomerase-like protein (cupin superfamily)